VTHRGPFQPRPFCDSVIFLHTLLFPAHPCCWHPPGHWAPLPPHPWPPKPPGVSQAGFLCSLCRRSCDRASGHGLGPAGQRHRAAAQGRDALGEGPEGLGQV